jgi:murein L,D-transpeptidase YafK
VKGRALCLLGAVMLSLSAAGTAGSVAAAETVTAAEEALHSLGKVGAAQIPVDTSAKEPLEQRLAARGMKIGNPIMIRIFKAESVLELWMRVGERFELFATYAICNWSGQLGPKLTEGDRQSPEGLYSVGRRQLRHSARWRRSLDLGFPNPFDRAHARTGSYVLLHGGCTSTGCFAMTDPIIEEIFLLSQAALRGGQGRIQVHVFPFHMTPENLAAHADSSWQAFWANLKEAYDLFERTRVPPSVAVCNRRYMVSQTEIDDDDCPASTLASTDVRAAAPETARPQAAPAQRSANLVALHRRPGRSALKAYAAARRARLATKARQRHAAEAADQRRLRR